MQIAFCFADATLVHVISFYLADIMLLISRYYAFDYFGFRQLIHLVAIDPLVTSLLIDIGYPTLIISEQLKFKR